VEHLERAAPARERRKGRVRLSVRDPFIEHALAGISIEGFNIDSTRSWGNVKLAEARQFLVGKPTGGERRIAKRDAYHALAVELARLAKEARHAR